jgi:hypothetical protein
VIALVHRLASVPVVASLLLAANLVATGLPAHAASLDGVGGSASSPKQSFGTAAGQDHQVSAAETAAEPIHTDEAPPPPGMEDFVGEEPVYPDPVQPQGPQCTDCGLDVVPVPTPANGGQPTEPAPLVLHSEPHELTRSLEQAPFEVIDSSGVSDEGPAIGVLDTGVLVAQGVPNADSMVSRDWDQDMSHWTEVWASPDDAAYVNFNWAKTQLSRKYVVFASLDLYTEISGFNECTACPVNVYRTTSNWAGTNISPWPGPSYDAANRVASRSFARGYYCPNGRGWEGFEIDPARFRRWLHGRRCQRQRLKT